MHDTEPGPQRRSQQAGSSRRPDERERLQAHLDRPSARALADDDVHLVVLEGGIENLLDRRGQTMDFVDEQDFSRLEVGHDPDQIAGLLDRRTRCRANRDAHLVRDHVREGRLAETRRAMQQDVIDRFAALACRGYRDLKILANAVLADVLVEHARTKSSFVLRVFVDPRRGHHPRVRHDARAFISPTRARLASTSARTRRRGRS